LHLLFSVNFWSSVQLLPAYSIVALASYRNAPIQSMLPGRHRLSLITSYAWNSNAQKCHNSSFHTTTQQCSAATVSEIHCSVYTTMPRSVVVYCEQAALHSSSPSNLYTNFSPLSPPPCLALKVHTTRTSTVTGRQFVRDGLFPTVRARGEIPPPLDRLSKLDCFTTKGGGKSPLHTSTERPRQASCFESDRFWCWHNNARASGCGAIAL
ncbi:unnamed protein product, partial [Ectocarpus sp. 13 AM-2016]